MSDLASSQPPALAHRHRDGLAIREKAALPGAPTLVWIHGLGESGLGFEGPMGSRELARFGHLAPDLLGYGRSPWTGAPTSLAGHATLLRAWLERNTAGELILVGHSMGGVVGTDLCERPGALASRLLAFVNVEGNVSPPDCTFSSQAERFSLADWLDHGYGQVLDGLYRDQDEDPAVLRPYCASIQMCDPRAFHRNATELVEWSATESLAATMAAIDRPAIYVFGAPRGSGDRSRGLLADAGVEMVGIPHAGHWPFLDQHDAFVTELLAFLARLGPET